MKKRLITSLMILTLGATALPMMSSCSRKGPIADFVMPEGGFDTNRDIDIFFAHSMGQKLQDALNAFIIDFNEMYPNIHITHNSVGSYDDIRDQMSTELAAGKPEADILYCYPDHVALYNQGEYVVTLDTLINDHTTMITDKLGNTEEVGLTKSQQDDFIPAYWNEGKALGDDKMYSLPLSKSSEVLYYDKTFFDAHKDEFQVPTTWVEMEEVCAKIKKLEPDCTPLGYDSDSNLFITLCEQYNSPYTSNDPNNRFVFNNAKNKEFVKMLKGWKDKGYLTTKGCYGSYTSSLFANDSPQRCYMCIGSSAGATYQLSEPAGRFEVGITSIPQVDAKNHPAVISQGPSLCLIRNDDPQKVLASWLFMKFLTTNTAFQAQFSMDSGYTPVLNSVFELPAYQAFLKDANGYNSSIAAYSVKVCVDQRDWYYYSPAFVGSSQARDEVGNLLTKILTEPNVTDDFIDQAFKEAVDECIYQAGGGTKDE